MVSTIVIHINHINVSTMVIHMQLHGYSCNVQYGHHTAIPRASGLCRNDRNSRNTEMETEHGTQKVLWCYLSSCLFRSLSSRFCSCSVWYAATSVPDQGHLFGSSFGLLIHLLDVWLPRLYWHFFRSSSGKEKTCCQSRSNGRELWSLDFTETMETENGKRKWKRKHGKYCECSQVPSYTADLALPLMLP